MSKAEKNTTGLKALKLVIKLDPLQLGVLYTTDAHKTKKRLYLVDLQNLLLLGDSMKMTEAIYSQHSSVFSLDKIPFEQVHNLLQKMMEFRQNELMEEDELLDSEDASAGKNRQIAYVK